MRRAKPIPIVVLAVLSLAALAAGCSITSSQPSPDQRQPSPNFDQTSAFIALIDETEELARLNGASDAQLADIATARAEGQVTFDLHAAAMYRLEDCLLASGDFDFVREVVTLSGVLTITGNINFPPGLEASQAFQIYDQCDTQEANFINLIYGSQPASVTAFTDVVEQHEATIRECLIHEGIPASELETTADLLEQSMHLNYRQSEQGLSNPVDCLGRSGIDW